MTATTMTYYERHLLIEQKRILAQTRCKVCQRPIGDKPHVSFEERYFHLGCVRKKRE